MVKYVPTYTKGTLKKKTAKDLSNAAYAMFLYVVFFFLIFFIKAYVVGTHLKCIEKDAIQMGTHNICLYEEVDKNTLAVIIEDYRIAWLCESVVIWSNTVLLLQWIQLQLLEYIYIYLWDKLIFLRQLYWYPIAMKLSLVLMRIKLSMSETKLSFYMLKLTFVRLNLISKWLNPKIYETKSNICMIEQKINQKYG